MKITAIDTRQGTANQHQFSNGNCLPYTGMPFGMNFFAPQTTEQNGSWWFHPNDRIFQGYRLTHQPSPWMGDFSHLLITPTSGSQAGYSIFETQSSYRPEESIFNPHQLEITQLRYQLTSRLTPTVYGACLTFDYAKENANNGFLLRAPGIFELSFDAKQRLLTGYTINFSGCEDDQFKMYFALQADCDFDLDNSGLITADFKGLAPLTDSQGGENLGVYLGFAATKEVELHLATSFISIQQAKLNLGRDLKNNFQATATLAAAKWQTYLDKIEVTSHKQPEFEKTFYHNMYRAFLFPQVFHELDGSQQKVYYDTLSKTVKKGAYYTNNGFWDTYKTVYPLFSLIAQDEYGDMLEGFLNAYRSSGYLPKWLSPDERGLMPGTLVDAVIADAAVKKIRPDLMSEFLEAMEKAATTQSDNPNYGRQGTLAYLKYGYVPLTYHESVNHTLDYCYSDFCISQVAQALGQNETYGKYRKQAKNYLNIFDPTEGLMRAKDEHGKFRDNFLDYRWGRDYAEGSAWQNSFAVYHDFKGLINAYPSQQSFLETITKLCNQRPIFNTEGYGCEIHEMSEMAAVEFGQLALSNQPSFHLPFLFTYAGSPAQTQVLLKQAMSQLFDSSTKGFPGDEDNGSMASWYIFNSLGFYPVCPGSGEYVLGIPLFDRAVIHLSSGKDLSMTATPNNPQQQFVTNVQLNQQDYRPLYLKHDDLIAGSQLDFELGLVPSQRIYHEDELPFSI